VERADGDDGVTRVAGGSVCARRDWMIFTAANAAPPSTPRRNPLRSSRRITPATLVPVSALTWSALAATIDSMYRNDWTLLLT
jgi:hypothetical protein